MPIFDQGYQHWQGKLSGRTWRWLIISRQGVRTGLKPMWVRIPVVFAVIPALMLVAFIALWGLSEHETGKGILQTIGLLPPAMKDSPRDFRVDMWTVGYRTFFQVQIFLSMIIVMLVGPRLISQDLRFNAIPLYFSRPLWRFDYFIGKLGVIGLILLAVAVLPAVIAYLLGLAFSLDLKVVQDTIWLLPGSILYGLIIALSMGSLILAFSSLSRSSLYVGAIWLGFWLFSATTGGIVSVAIRDDWCGLVSYTANLERVGDKILGADKAMQNLSKAWGIRGSGAGPPPAPERRPADPRKQNRSVPPEEEERMARRFHLPDPPWYWSAGVLVALFGISAWILMFRVKTLDRLK